MPLNRYAVLVGKDLEDVRIEMADLPQQGGEGLASHVEQAPTTTEEESELFGSMEEPPVRYETKPPPIRSLYPSVLIGKELVSTEVGLSASQATSLLELPGKLLPMEQDSELQVRSFALSR